MKTIEEKAKAYATNNATIPIFYNPDVKVDISKQIKLAYLAGATEALAGQWRSVEDELPKAEQDVLVAIDTQTNHQFAFAWLSTLSNGTLRWYSYDDTFPLDKIRYWMSIPEPPKDESE
ncbi:MAG: DUF551 domain-containing protein [Muribaculaceae bacterium]|nr:DUF551 domain-containing protein [Muribaculaceae bacterium]